MLRHVHWQMKHLHWGLGDKMEDWVERLHQWGMQQRRRYRTVQNPLIRATAQEKATSRNTHPEVLAQLNATDEGNKRKMSEVKVDILSAKQKWQHEEGRIRAMKYFSDVKKEKLTWAEILFNSVKGGGCEKNDDIIVDDAKLAPKIRTIDSCCKEAKASRAASAMARMAPLRSQFQEDRGED